MADLVFEHFRKYPDQTLGVVAFSVDQKHAIEEELERKVGQNLEYERFLNPKGPCEFFVKNLEIVQGDQRDVMFLSVGYGKDSRGHMSLNFGPLNGENGVRRLNVAITRARLHVKLVSSIVPEDINLANTASRGTQLLRAYMEYARAGGSETALHGALSLAPDAESESPFEESVYRALTNRGLILHRQVGCSGYRIDLAVVDSQQQGRYLLGIECDGATYHSAKTARDRDRLRQQVLEDLGWKILRIWSRDWIADPNAQVIRVLEALKNEKTQGDIVNAEELTLKKNSFDVQTPKFDLHPSAPAKNAVKESSSNGVIQYKTAVLRQIGTPEMFWSAPSATLNSIVLELVMQEGPIELRSACRRVLGCWGITKLTSTLQARVSASIRALASQNQIVVRDGFLWSIGTKVLPVRYPPAGESPREIEEIAIEEIGQGSVYCLQKEFTLSRGELVTQTARLLGFTRTSERIRQRIERAIEQLMSTNRVRMSNDKVELVR